MPLFLRKIVGSRSRIVAELDYKTLAEFEKDKATVSNGPVCRTCGGIMEEAGSVIAPIWKCHNCGRAVYPR